MITFSNIIKLVTLVWLMNILSAGYCKAENSNLDCMITPKKNVQDVNSRKIPVMNKCPKGYENKSIIESCEVLINRNDPLDTELFRPVTSNITNEVYWNVYCATCNNDTEIKYITFFSWNRYMKDYERCGNLKQRIQRSEVDDIQNLTRAFINDGVKMIAERPDNTQMECSMNGKWPVHLIFTVIPCLHGNFHTSQDARLKTCQYAEKTGGICTRMKFFFDGLAFYFENRKDIDFNETLSEYKFTPGQYYVETEYPGVFYICDLPATIYGGKHSVKIPIVIISLLFIVFNLGINMNKQHLQKNNTNKLLYLYMVGLIPISIILLLIYLSHPVPCVAFYLAQFSWAYHFFWSILIFIEFCLLTFGALHNRFVHGSRYVVYFLFGFAIPLVMPIIYYFGVLILNENYKEDISQPFSPSYILEYTCPIVPNHFGVSCTSYHKFGSRYYEEWLELFLTPSFYFFIPTLFFGFLIISIVVVWYFIKYRSGGIRSIPKRDHLIVITKMVSIMGIHWLLFKIYQSYGNDHSIRILGVSLDTICQLSIDLHGIIVFIVFGAETCIGFIMNMCGCEYKSVSQRDGDDGMEIS